MLRVNCIDRMIEFHKVPEDALLRSKIVFTVYFLH